MNQPRLSDFGVLTFDCYGTLIDWETGILEALEPWMRRRGAAAPGDKVLEVFARFESEQEAETPDLLYPKVLERVHKRLAGHYNIPSSDEEATAFGASVPDWPAFPDSTQSLEYLKDHYKLVIVSNIDRASFAGSNRRLGVDFDAVFTAQDVGSYKPDPANFEYMIAGVADLGFDKSRILHVAQSLFHDHEPARRIGLATMWIDRRHGREGWGATSPPTSDVATDFRADGMADFVTRHREDTGQ